jgi:hypothetical protein
MTKTDSLNAAARAARDRQARALAAQRDLVPGTDKTPQQPAEQQQVLKAETRERRPEWFA